ncbi:aldehyde dehydrogenase family protein [Streptomyces sp. NPDC023838]|uniref:aldehyde dehydrogenase family protein n=1 Tax=Streptomyces sp. NPDC023838 TaxID=3154325 RepID=UPI0033CD5970
MAEASSPPPPYSFGDQLTGSWRPGRATTTTTVTDPYTGKVLLDLADADTGDVAEAFTAARAAQREWGDALPSERADVLRRAVGIMERRREEIITWLIQESGSTRMKATAEWHAVRAITLHASTLPHLAEGRIIPADVPGKENRLYRKPVGVVSVISPWNWPAHLTTRVVAPALVLGNSVVVKPSQETPVTGGFLFGRIFAEAGLPQGVLNVVSGPASAIGDAFVLNPLSPLLSFTGSTQVGRHIASQAATAPMLKRVALELGGNNPLVVLDDADLDLATDAAVFGRFFHQGEICISANRVIVQDAVHDAFVDRYVDRVRELKYGDPNEEDTVVGPLISRRQLDNVLDLLARSRAQGATTLLGGDPEGLVLPPHVLADVTNDMAVACNEIFGPVAPVIRAADEEEALRIANDTEYGLSSAVFSADGERALAFAHRIEAGMTHINDSPVVDMPNTPFGGDKNSGLGRFGTHALLDELTRQHWISVQHTRPAYPF